MLFLHVTHLAVQQNRRERHGAESAAAHRLLEALMAELHLPPAPVRTTSNTTHSLFQAQIIRSDDHGKTWTCNAVPALYDADESKIVELNDGTLLVKSRNQNKGNVYYATSTDDGKTWSERKTFDIKDSACNGDVIRLTSMSKEEGDNRLLLSIPFANDRRNVSVFLSRDETGTWPIRKTV